MKDKRIADIKKPPKLILKAGPVTWVSASMMLILWASLLMLSVVMVGP